MMKFSYYLVLIATFSFSNLVAQTKNEKESRVSMSQFPESAQLVLEYVPEKARRIKYYKETDGDKLSFESKFKYNKHWYSVEFDNNGTLEDIEKTIKKKHLNDTLKTAINAYLNLQTSKFDILKIQEQYLYNNKTSQRDFLNTILTDNASIRSNYEIIIALKKDGFWLLAEMTFDFNGQFLKSRNLQPESYEYIMY